jgi:predicted nucleic acid-binding protein
MTVYLPDTNILIDAFRDKRGRRGLLSRLVSEGNSLACCAVTVAEIYSGMQLHEAPRTDAFLSALVWHNTNRAIARRAGRLRFDYARQGITLSLADTLIAAIALEHGLTLITANRKDFPMVELTVYPLEAQ